LARRINTTPIDNGAQEILYRFRCTCRAPDESHVRALLLQNVGRTPLALVALQSKDNESLDRVDVKAFLKSIGRKDEFLENVVTHLSLESSVTSIAWEVVASADAEDASLAADKLVDSDLA
jgi:putative Mg2+ transporter-C (MgtC) family protein